MRYLFFTSVSGWTLVLLLGVTIALPYQLRAGETVVGANRASGYLKNLRLHYWLGYAIALISFAHTWVPMSAGWAGRLNATGLYAATGALLLVYVQVLLGRQLRNSKSGKRVLRRIHFWTMVGIVALVLVHIALNSVMLQALIH